MINPQLSHGRYLFVRNSCPYCRLYKKIIFKLNSELRLDKQIEVIDCTRYDMLGIMDQPIIKVFEEYLESYPTLIIDGEIKQGANSVLECLAFLKARLFSDFYFEQEPEYLPITKRYTLFSQKCKHQKGRLICEDG